MIHQKAHEKFSSYLKDGKHRVTPERFEVLDAALNYEGHFGADELFIDMKVSKSSISRATVYNTLELLGKCGVIKKRNFGDNKARFEASFNRKAHDHLICITCGNIREFSNDKIANIVEEICEELGYESNGYSFNIFGKCKKGKSCEHFKEPE